MNEQEIFSKLWGQSPLVALLVLILVGGYKKWWVWGYQLAEAQKALAEMKAERDKVWEVTWHAFENSRRAVTATEKVVDALKVQP